MRSATILGHLLVPTRLVPRWVDLLALVDGPILFVSGIAKLGAYPSTSPIVIGLALPTLAFEVSLANPLIAKGAKRPALDALEARASRCRGGGRVAEWRRQDASSPVARSTHAAAPRHADRRIPLATFMREPPSPRSMPDETRPKSKRTSRGPASRKGAANAKAPPKASAKKSVPLLSGGNPQIPKGDGDAPVQAYIAAMPGWKRDVGKRLDALIVRHVPDVRKAVKWNSPFYGIEGRGWFLSYHVFTRYVKVTFFAGKLLRPIPPGGTPKSGDARWIDVHEDGFDEAQVADWVKQAAALPGWVP